MSWIAPGPFPVVDPACWVSGESATDACLGCGIAGEDLGHPMAFAFHPNQSQAELGGPVADEVVGRLVPDVDMDHPALAADRDPGRAEPGGECGQVAVDLDRHHRPRGGYRGG